MGIVAKILTDDEGVAAATEGRVGSIPLRTGTNSQKQIGATH
jgi:hypothetical protein